MTVRSEETLPADAEVVAALADDPSGTLATLYDRHAGLVYGLALKILASPAEAEDLTQEVFVTLAHASTYDPTRGSLTAYLVTMTRSRAIDRLRSRSRGGRLLERYGDDPERATVVASPFDALADRERTSRVRAALATLPEIQRRVLELAYFKGLSQSEISVEIGSPLGSVKTWARKGLMSLRGLLAGSVE